MEEGRLKNRVNYFWEDIILLNKIDLDKARPKKVTFSNCAVFKNWRKTIENWTK